MKRVEFKNEYALHSTANSMLVIADAGFNIQQTVIYKTCETLVSTFTQHTISFIHWLYINSKE